MEQKKGHPIICPKCKYNRPIALSYCPHCREQERDRKDPQGAALKQMFTKMWIKVVDADTLPSKQYNNDKPSTKGENTQQKKQQSTNGKTSSKLQSVQRARKRTTKKPNGSSKTAKAK